MPLQRETELKSAYPKDERRVPHLELEPLEDGGVALAIALLGCHVDAHREHSRAPFTEQYRQLLNLIYTEVARWIQDPENQLDTETLVQNPDGVEQHLTLDLSEHPEIFAVVTQMNDLFIRDSRGGFEVSQDVEFPVLYAHEADRSGSLPSPLAEFRILGVAPSIAGQPGEPKLHVRLLQMPNALEASAAVHRAERKRTFAT